MDDSSLLSKYKGERDRDCRQQNSIQNNNALYTKMCSVSTLYTSPSDNGLTEVLTSTSMLMNQALTLIAYNIPIY